MSTPSPFQPDSRREFVKKSIAASVVAAQPTLLAGLLRADGGGGGGVTTLPETTVPETTVPETTFPETSAPWDTTFEWDTTAEWSTIESSTTEEETTLPPTWETTLETTLETTRPPNAHVTKEKILGSSQPSTDTSAWFDVMVHRREEGNVRGALEFHAQMRWEFSMKNICGFESQDILVRRDCMSLQVTGVKLKLAKTPMEEDGDDHDWDALQEQSYDGPDFKRGFEVEAEVESGDAVLISTGCHGELDVINGGILVKIEGAIEPPNEENAKEKVVSWKVTPVFPEFPVDSVRNSVVTALQDRFKEEDFIITFELGGPVASANEIQVKAIAHLTSSNVDAGAGCNL